MALTTNQLGIHLGLIESGELPEPNQTKLNLIRRAATSEIAEYVGNAAIPDALLDMACIRLAGYLFDEAPERRNKNLNPLRASGAMALLVRHRGYKVSEAIIITDDQFLADGFTQSEITKLKQLAAETGGFLRLED